MVFRVEAGAATVPQRWYNNSSFGSDGANGVSGRRGAPFRLAVGVEEGLKWVLQWCSKTGATVWFNSNSNSDDATPHEPSLSGSVLR